MGSDGSVTIEIVGDASEFEESLEKVKESAQAFAELLEQFGRSASDILSGSAGATDRLGEDLSSAGDAADSAADSMDGLSDSMGGASDGADDLSDSMGEAGDSTEELYDYIQQMEEASLGSTDAMDDLGDSLSDAADGADDLGGGLDDLGDGLDDLSDGADDAGGNLDDVIDDIDDLDDSADNAGDSVSNLGDIFKGTFLGNLAANAVTALASSLTDLAVNSVQAGMDFSNAMSQVGATMGLSVEEIQNGSTAFTTMEEAAKAAGASTAFSATEAAEALNYLALAGYDAATASDTLPAVLNLAAAGGLDLAYASDLATDAMSALGIEASNENLTQFGDKLSKTASTANASVAQLGEAILVVGGTAKGLAGGTTELNAALGVLANRGIKGAEGGTALRNVILSLTAPTDKAAEKLKELGIEVNDAEGNMRPLNEIFKDFNASLANMSESDKTNALNEIFNKVDLKSVQALLAGCGDEFDNLTTAIENSGGAMQDMADVQLDNLQGDVTIMQSALEGLQIAIFDKMEGPMRSATQAVTGLVSGLQGLISGTTQVNPAVAGLASALSAAFVSMPIVANIGKIVTGIKNMGAALKALNLIGLLTNPATLAIAAIAGLVAVIVTLNSRTKELSETEQILADYNAQMVSSIDAMAQSQQQLVESRQSNVAAMQAEFSQTEAYLSELRSLTDENGKVKEGYEQRAAILADYINSIVPGAVSAASDESGAYYQISEAIDELIFKKKQEALINAYMPEYQDALKNQVQAYKDVSDATYAYAAAQERVENLNQRIAQGERGLSGELRDAKAAAEEAGQALDNAKANLDGVQSSIDSMNALQAIDTSQGLAAAMQQLDAAAAQASGQIVKYTGENTAAIEQSLGSMAAAYQQQAIIVSQGWGNMNEAERQGAQASLNTLRTAFNQQVAEARKAGIEVPTAYGDGMYSGIPQLSGAAAEVYATTLQAMFPDASAEEIGAMLSSLYASGILSAEGEATSAGSQVVGDTKSSMDGSVAGAGFEDTGNQTTTNYASGITAAQNTAFSAAASLISGTKGQTDSAVAGAGFDAPGGTMDSLLATGISGAVGTVTQAVQAMVQSTKGTAGSTASSLNFSSVGNMISSGIAAGIRNGGGLISSAVTGVIGTALAAAKRAAQVASPSKLFRDEVGVYIGEGIAVGIEKATDDVNSAVEDLVYGSIGYLQHINQQVEDIQAEATKRQAEKDLQAHEKAIADKEKRITELEVEAEKKIGEAKEEERAEVEADYKEKREQAQQELLDLQEDWAQKQIDAEEKAALDSLKNQQDYLNDLVAQRQSFAEKISLGTDELFTRDDKSNKLSLTNLEQSIAALEQYSDSLDAIRARGMDTSLMNEILGMGREDATDYMNQLLAMTDEQYEQYLATWEEYQEKAKAVAANVYQPELDALGEGFEEFLSTIPDTAEPAGEAAMEALKDGIVSKGEEAVSAAERIADRIKAALEGINYVEKFHNAAIEAGGRISAKLTTSSNAAAEAKKASQSDTATQYASMFGLMSAASQEKEIVLNVDGREMARALVPDIRAVEDQSPRIVSD